MSKMKILPKPRRLIIIKPSLNKPSNNKKKVRRTKICAYCIKNPWKLSALSIFKKSVLNVLFSVSTRAMSLKVFNKFNKKMMNFIISCWPYMTKKLYSFSNLGNNYSSLKEVNESWSFVYFEHQQVSLNKANSRKIQKAYRYHQERREKNIDKVGKNYPENRKRYRRFIHNRYFAYLKVRVMGATFLWKTSNHRKRNFLRKTWTFTHWSDQKIKKYYHSGAVTRQ